LKPEIWLAVASLRSQKSMRSPRVVPAKEECLAARDLDLILRSCDDNVHFLHLHLQRQPLPRITAAGCTRLGPPLLPAKVNMRAGAALIRYKRVHSKTSPMFQCRVLIRMPACGSTLDAKRLPSGIHGLTRAAIVVAVNLCVVKGFVVQNLARQREPA
jgi:hypothetical protein